MAFTLLSEFLPTKSRARVLILFELFFALGSMFEGAVAWIVLPRWGWRWQVAVSALPLLLPVFIYPVRQAAAASQHGTPISPHTPIHSRITGHSPSIVLTCISACYTAGLSQILPESPRFYMSVGQPAKALHVLQRAAKANNRPASVRHVTLCGMDPHGANAGPRSAHHTSSSGSDRSPEPKEAETGRAQPSATDVDPGGCAPLVRSPLAKTTMLLAGIWFVSAFCYYGLVLMVTVLFEAERLGERCPAPLGLSPVDGGGSETVPGRMLYFDPMSRLLQQTGTGNGTSSAVTDCIPFEAADYQDTLITSIAEVPGLLLVAVLIDRIGRKRTVTVTFLASAVSFCLLWICMPRLVETSILFSARTFVTGAFQSMFVYTPEVFPTSVRGTALGVASSAARVGGMITPYVAQVLLHAHVNIGIGLYGVAALLAAVAGWCLPVETMGRPMMGTLADFRQAVKRQARRRERAHTEDAEAESDDVQALELSAIQRRPGSLQRWRRYKRSKRAGNGVYAQLGEGESRGGSVESGGWAHGEGGVGSVEASYEPEVVLKSDEEGGEGGGDGGGAAAPTLPASATAPSIAELSAKLSASASEALSTAELDQWYDRMTELRGQAGKADQQAIDSLLRKLDLHRSWKLANQRR